jgi:lsr operon transcriptional repressor
VRDPDVARNLSSEAAVANLLEMALNASYQLVGIGELSAISTVVRSGYVSPDEVEPLRRKGAPSVSWQGAALLSA